MPKTRVPRSARWAAILLFIGVACGAYLALRPRYADPISVPVPELKLPAIVEPIDHGNGVYEFPTVNQAFTKAIIAFLNDPDHAGLHCHLLADTYGYTSGTGRQYVTGHLLQCHDASVYAQAETVP